MESILIIDDEEDIRDLLSYNLRQAGFQTDSAENGSIGLEKARKLKPDLIILDVMMPGMDGIEVCERLRTNEETKSIKICFLTARNEDYSQIAGLDAGADDYVSKPVKPKVLISRIKALLRRTGENDLVSDEKRYKDDLVIDREKYQVIKDGKVIHLPRKEFELLALLATKPDFVFERDVIMERVWGNEVIVGDRTIDVHVRKLREKIGDQYIKTIKGVGYKFVHS